MKFIFLVSIIIIFFSIDLHSSVKKKNTFCEPSLKVQTSVFDLIAYFEELQNANFFTSEHLLFLMEGLKKGEVLNPLNAKQLTAANQYIHQEAIDEILANQKYSSKDVKVILSWAEQILVDQYRNTYLRLEAIKQTKQVYRQMNFISVPLASVISKPRDLKARDYTITKPFEILNTPVTQWQWAVLMEENPSEFVHTENYNTIRINGKEITLSGDHPVDSVSLLNIRTALKKLNEWSKKEDPRIYKLISDHRPRSVYRLPTSAEYVYLYLAFDPRSAQFHFGPMRENIKDTEIEQYAWIHSNSNKQTQEVARKLPLLVNENAIYDLYGNVSEWTENVHLENEFSKPVKALLSLFEKIMQIKSSPRYVLRGGSWKSFYFMVGTTRAENSFPHIATSEFGFRLVREK